jgi:hypothetical protein
MRHKFLNWFGLTTLTTYREMEDRAKDYHKLISDLTAAIAEYESKPKSTVEYKDYKPYEHGSSFNKKLFDEWYSIYCKNQYQAYKLRQLSKHPHLLNAFMNEFGSFDWESIHLHMEENNWFWHDNSVSPTIEEMKDCVITLIPENRFDTIGNAVSSGGFTVSLYYDENCNSICKIEFKK